MRINTPQNTQHQAIWTQADLMLNWTLLVTCLLVIGVRWRLVGTSIVALPMFWLVLMLMALAAGEIRTLRAEGRRWAPAALMPLAFTLASLIGVWQVHPGVHMWVLISILLAFTRFAPGLALALGAFSLSVSVAILILHWQSDWRLLVPATMAGILELGILFIFFRASQRSRAALDQTRELLSNSVSSMAQGLQVISPQGQVILHNQRLLELLELPAHLRAEPVNFDAIETYLQRRQTARATVGELARDEGQATFDNLRTPSGQTLEVRTQTLPDLSQVRTYTDVSLYEQARQAALTHSQAKDRFLSNMSHELRTPLSGLLGVLGLMAQTPLASVQRDYLKQALQTGQSLLNSVNDLLDFSRIETGQLVLQPQPLALQGFLAELAGAAADHLEHKPIELVFDLDEALPASVLADGQRLRQVLLNLLRQALQTTEQGEVSLQVRVVSSQADAVELAWCVSDTGAGLTAQAQSQIFDAFSQLDASPSRRQGGVGLELAICQRLLTLMGSTLRVDSAPGRGSRMAFTLTLQQPVAASQNLATPPRTVWVLDSNPQTREHTLKLLAQAGCTARVVEPIHRIWSWLQQAAEEKTVPDAVLMSGSDWKLADGKLAEHIARRWAETYPQLAAPLWLAAINHHDQFKPEAGAAAQPITRLLKPVLPSVLRSTLEAPRPSQMPAPQALASDAAPLPASDGKLAHLQVLLAEDDPINRRVSCQLLSQQGCVITLATNGQEAVDLLAQSPDRFDVVLMDLQMPVMDGLEAARAIREQLQLETLPIFALSANVSDLDRMACLEAGMDQHLAKPFDLDKVVQALYPFVKRASATVR